MRACRSTAGRANKTREINYLEQFGPCQSKIAGGCQAVLAPSLAVFGDFF